ncbi:unnamed protein product [Calypogeia fissa]
MVDGGVEAPPPVKRKRGRPRKADILAAQQAAGIIAADGSVVAPPSVNGVPAPVPNALGVPAGLKPEPKPRKSRKKKGEILPPPGVDQTLVGKTVTGVLDGSFDAGYLLSVRVGDSETVLRGVVFGPGLAMPITKNNDVAQGVKVVKRDETLPVPAASPISVLVAPAAAAAAPASAYPSQTPAPPATAAYVQTAPVAVPKAVTAPAGASLPAVSVAESNSQVNPAQGSVQPYPTPVPQATPAA